MRQESAPAYDVKTKGSKLPLNIFLSRWYKPGSNWNFDTQRPACKPSEEGYSIYS